MNNNQIEIDLNQIRVNIILDFILFLKISLKDPSGVFELIEFVGNGTYGQVYKMKFQFILQVF